MANFVRQLVAGLAKFTDDILSAVQEAETSSQTNSPHSTDSSCVSSYRSSAQGCAVDGGSTTEPQAPEFNCADYSDAWEGDYEATDDEPPTSVSPAAEERFAFLDFRRFQFGASLSRKDQGSFAVMTFRFCQALSVSRSVPHSMLVMCVVRTLSQCGPLGVEDMEQTLAVALANLEKVSRLLDKMNTKERTMVAVVQLFLAHSFLSDEVMPLKTWHSMFFEDYCDLVTLEDAVVKLWRHNDYKIMVDDETRERMVEALRQKVNVRGRATSDVHL